MYIRNYIRFILLNILKWFSSLPFPSKKKRPTYVFFCVQFISPPGGNRKLPMEVLPGKKNLGGPKMMGKQNDGVLRI